MATARIEIDQDIQPLSEFRAERQIARGEVVSHEEAKKRIKENLAKWE